MFCLIKNIIFFLKNRLKEICKRHVLEHPLSYNIIFSILGIFILQWIRIVYGKDTHIFFIRGKTGDFYLYNLYFQQYLVQKNIKKFIFIGDGKGFTNIKNLFGIQCKAISTKFILAHMIQKAYMLSGGNFSYMTHSLLWDVDLYFNRCRTRMLDKYTFMDSFRFYLFNLTTDKIDGRVNFQRVNKKCLERMGIIKNRTIILSPYAYCVKWMPVKFWNILIYEIRKKGFSVLINIAPGEENPFDAKSIFFTYSEGKDVLEYAGYFLGLRSGFCDIISSVSCKKIILYPKRTPIVDYSSHRCDAIFSSMVRMGISHNDVEIESCLVQDISNHFEISNDYEFLDKEMRYIITKITESLV